jgi:hypothetical protein
LKFGCLIQRELSQNGNSYPNIRMAAGCNSFYPKIGLL